MPKRMIYSMSGPRLRAVIDEMIPMTPEEREKRMEKMKTAEMHLIAGILQNCLDDLDKIYEAILWEKGGDKYSLEIKKTRT